MAPGDIVTFTKFLLVAVVILPIVPNQPITPFKINPLSVWWIVVAVSFVSYGGYLLQRAIGGRGGFVTAALLGGAYSSTAATVAMARSEAGSGLNYRLAGGVLLASAVALPRELILVALVCPPLAARLLPYMLSIAVAAGAVGLALATRQGGPAQAEAGEGQPRGNPLELRSAFLFAALFVATLVVTQLVSQHAGRAGVLGFSAIVGLTDISPFVVGIAGNAAHGFSLASAAAAVLVATASNNVAKGIYAMGFARGKAGRGALVSQMIMGAASLAAAVIVTGL